MKLPNLNKLMMSITDFKKQLTDIVNKNETKVIMRNNMPVSIFMPYSEYVESEQNVNVVGQEITMENGVKVKAVVGEEFSLGRKALVVKTYLKMKNSDEYKLHHTHYMSTPSVEETLTKTELSAKWDKEYQEFLSLKKEEEKKRK